MFGADTGDPGGWVGGPFLFLLALFSSALFEGLFFLAPYPRPSFEPSFEELLFLLFFQTLFVELEDSGVQVMDPSWKEAYLVIWCIDERE